MCVCLPNCSILHLQESQRCLNFTLKCLRWLDGLISKSYMERKKAACNYVNNMQSLYQWIMPSFMYYTSCLPNRLENERQYCQGQHMLCYSSQDVSASSDTGTEWSWHHPLVSQIFQPTAAGIFPVSLLSLFPQVSVQSVRWAQRWWPVQNKNKKVTI